MADPTYTGSSTTFDADGYRYLRLLSSGTLEHNAEDFTFDVLVQGGGAGGHRFTFGAGGGGGGGEHYPLTGIAFTTDVTVTIGAGGAGGTQSFDSNNTSPGGDTIFGAYTAAGGGQPGRSNLSGGQANQYTGPGSGGGGVGETNVTPGGVTTTTNFANDGGDGSGSSTDAQRAGGGGGGAGAPGGDASINVGGAGGDGRVWLDGVTYGGGGGGGVATGVAGAGGAGGGGRGGRNSASAGGLQTPLAGTANTGGGGGGCGSDNFDVDGGSGIVVVRWSLGGPPTPTGTGSITDQQDTASGTSTVNNPNGGAVTDQQDTAVGTATVTNPVTTVLYRVNPVNAVTATDAEIDWSIDTTTTDVTVGGGTSTNTANGTPASIDSSVPSYVPAGVWTTDRYGGGGSDVDIDFVVEDATDYVVNFFLRNTFGGTDQVGDRVFSISIDGVVVAASVDCVDLFGHNVGGMLSFSVTSVDTLMNITLEQVATNGFGDPLYNAIEIRSAEAGTVTGSGSVTDQQDTAAGSSSTLSTGSGSVTDQQDTASGTATSLATIPDAPTSVVATAGDEEVVVTWTDETSAEPEATYVIEYKSNG